VEDDAVCLLRQQSICKRRNTVGWWPACWLLANACFKFQPILNLYSIAAGLHFHGHDIGGISSIFLRYSYDNACFKFQPILNLYSIAAGLHFHGHDIGGISSIFLRYSYDNWSWSRSLLKVKLLSLLCDNVHLCIGGCASTCNFIMSDCSDQAFC
jgi:hypothetical protein